MCMKKLLLFLLITGNIYIASINGMEPQAKAQADPVKTRIHTLKVLEADDAKYHERNSFVDAYMNPSSFEFSETQLSFAHYKYSDVKYSVSWEAALEYLTDASSESAKLNEMLRQNKQLPLLMALKGDPDTKLSEAQKYELQILSFVSFLNLEDFDQNAPAWVAVVTNRARYADLFKAKDAKGVQVFATTHLHTSPFQSLSCRIKNMRLILQKTRPKVVPNSWGKILEAEVRQTDDQCAIC